MRLIVFSDSHGDIANCRLVLDRIPCDKILHLGDVTADALTLQKLYPNINVEYVGGNNDYCRVREKVTEAGGVRIFMAHGHNHGVSYGTDRLYYAALEQNCSIALFGHTHRPHQERSEGILLLNPGSISRPRGGVPSCLIIEIENGKADFMLYELPY